VISSVRPFRQAEGSAWQRINPLAVPATDVNASPGDARSDDLDAKADETAEKVPPPPFYMLDLPFPSVEWSELAINSGVSNALVASTPESRMGQAMHWLLEIARPMGPAAGQFEAAGSGTGGFGEMLLSQAGRMFELSTAQVCEAARLAQGILAGEGAWAWDAAVVDWHGNEVELLHQGRLLRLDRLVRRTAPAAAAGWWVLDYKMTTTPERQPELVAQLLGYRAAVQAAYPDQAVTAAFLTGNGRQVVVD
jgi:ATP-dependent helicase/nuclease subunit A